MLPLVGISPLVGDGLQPYRDVFCRDSGFAPVSCSISGLLLSLPKTLPGIYAHPVWPEAKAVSRRARHAAVWEAGWDREQLMRQHRPTVAAPHRGRGWEVLSLEWTYTHQERGPPLDAGKRAYAQVPGPMSRYQSGVTALVANREALEGVAVAVQFPNYHADEGAYLAMTAPAEYSAMEAARRRLLAVRHEHKNRLPYRKRTDRALEMGRQVEPAGHFPHAPYAFDQGVLSLPVPPFIEQPGTHRVSDLEPARRLHWQGQGRRAGDLAAALRPPPPQSVRPWAVPGGNGEEPSLGVFTTTLRLKRSGRKRRVSVPEQADLSGHPRL